jgi:UDP-glucose 4-epimerase
LAEVFVYKRMGQIVELLLGNGQCSVEELMEALTKLASNSVLMNALDRRQLDNTLANILDNSKIPTFLSNDQYAKIMDLRYESILSYTSIICV